MRRSILARLHGLGGRTFVIAAMFFTGASSLTATGALAQRNNSSSVRTQYVIRECPQGYWNNGWVTLSYEGTTWATSWRLLSNSGSPPRGTFKASSAGNGDSFLNVDRTKSWSQPRMQATCWFEEWVNIVTGQVFWYTTYTGITYSGTVTNVDKDEEEETTCLYDLGCDDEDGGGGSEGGGGGSSEQLWQTCIYTVYTDRATGRELWRELDYCYTHN